MASVYTTSLFIAHAVDDEYFDLPDDKLYVIRQITCFFPGLDVFPAAQLIETASNATLWWVHETDTLAGYFENYPDLRIVLPVGARLNVTGTGSPDISISGYALSLP